jgi:PAS domain S-box-containing protein
MRPRCSGVLTAIVLLCVLSFSLPARAQERHLRFDRLTVEHGLSNAWVLSMLRDSRGFLWIGTDDGLDRYDGSRFKVYGHDPQDPHSLASPVAGALCLDGKGRLWVGSGWSHKGVALYDPELDRFKTYLPSPNQDVGNDVRVIVEDREGQLWLGTDDGIVRFDPEKSTFDRFPLTPDSGASGPTPFVASLFEDSKNRFWVGTSAGLLQFDRTRGKYRRWSTRSSDLAALSSAEIWDFHEDAEGQLWIATLGAGLFHVDVNAGQGMRYLPDPRDPDSISSARVRRLVAAGEGTLYVGTENGGLDVLDLRTQRFTHQSADPEDEASLSSASIWSMYLDDQDILWIGTYNGGVNYVSPLGQRFQRLRARPGGLSDAHVGSVMEDHLGNVWIGTEGGLDKLDPKTGRFTYYRHDPKNAATIGSDAIHALLEDSGGTIWLGGWDSGLCRLDPASGRVRCFRHNPSDPTSLVNNNLWRILELRTGELLVVTHGGADLFDRRTGSFRRLTDIYPGAGEGALFGAAEDRGGNLWLVGSVFVGYVDRKTGEVVRYHHDPEDPNSLGSGWTQAVQIDSVGNVWLGTQGGLTCIAAGTKKTRRYMTDDGLPNNTIKCIAEDDAGNLWLGTNRGISKLENAIRIPDKPTFVNFDAQDGLQGYEFERNAAFRGRNGEMFFGGSRGLSYFFPERIGRNTYKPPVVFTDLKVRNEPVGIGTPGSPLTKAITQTKQLTLSYKDSMVTFEFAALNLYLPQKNQYKYMLEGFDKAWNDVGTQHTATYTNLPYGTFTLRVRASNNDGVWNDEGASLEVRVKPPIWLTLPAYLLYILVAAAALFVWVRWRERASIERQRELAQKVEERTNDLQAERDLLHSLMDNIPDYIYFKDAEGRYTRINRAYAEGLGLASPEEAAGRTDADFQTAAFAEASRADEAQIVRTAKPLLGKVEQDSRRDTWHLVTKVPIRDVSGQVTGLVGISKDITERRQAEERLREDLETFRTFVTQVAAGDLTRRGHVSDETLSQISGFVNQMLDGFTAMLSEVRDAAFSVSTASSEILATSLQITKGAEHGRDQVFNTTSAVEEMVRSMQQIASNAEASAEAAQRVMERLTASDRDVDVAVQGMTEIDAAVSATAEKMHLLGQRSKEIFAITDLIEDIAGRSELLSLNAAIEAAHAGEAGKGFAVVAEEIRRLAERSSDATKEVAAIVKAMAGETHSVLSAMENSTLRVKKGVELSQHAREGLQEISLLVQRAAELARQISASVDEQATSSQTVSEAMQAIMNVSEQSTAATTETNKAVRDLVSLSETLTRVIARFKIESPEAYLADDDLDDGDVRDVLAKLVTQVHKLEQKDGEQGASGDRDSSAAIRALASALERTLARGPKRS